MIAKTVLAGICVLCLRMNVVGVSAAEIHAAASAGNLDKVRALVMTQPGAVNDQDYPQRLTPLHLAAQAGHLEVVKYLLANQAALNAADTAGRTPLYVAVATGQEQIAQYLREQGGRLAVAALARPSQPEPEPEPRLAPIAKPTGSNRTTPAPAPAAPYQVQTSDCIDVLTWVDAAKHGSTNVTTEGRNIVLGNQQHVLFPITLVGDYDVLLRVQPASGQMQVRGHIGSKPWEVVLGKEMASLKGPTKETECPSIPADGQAHWISIQFRREDGFARITLYDNERLMFTWKGSAGRLNCSGRLPPGRHLYIGFGDSTESIVLEQAFIRTVGPGSSCTHTPDPPKR